LESAFRKVGLGSAPAENGGLSESLINGLSVFHLTVIRGASSHRKKPMEKEKVVKYPSLWGLVQRQHATLWTWKLGFESLIPSKYASSHRLRMKRALRRQGSFAFVAERLSILASSWKGSRIT
jgi:hypothetical protein